MPQTWPNLFHLFIGQTISLLVFVAVQTAIILRQAANLFTHTAVHDSSGVMRAIGVVSMLAMTAIVVCCITFIIHNAGSAVGSGFNSMCQIAEAAMSAVAADLPQNLAGWLPWKK